VVAGEHLPSQRRDRPGLAPGSLTALPFSRRAYHSAVSTEAASVRRSPVATWLPVVLWAAVIFAFSSAPSLGTDLGTWDTILRKLAHLAEYAVLGALLARATRRAVAAVALAVLYAVTDEVHQVFVEGRHGSPLDVGIDTLGAIVGVLAWGWLARRRTGS
jgi:VanZ family protein